MNIFNLPLEEFEKEVDKFLEGMSPEELLNELKKYGLKIKGESEMREYKFRGKSINKNEWIYGSLYCQIDSNYKKIYYILNKDFIKVLIPPINVPTEVPSFNSVNEDTVGQYTGLKDKNGVEIYEGDIVYCQTKFGKAKAIIEFINGKFVARFDSAVTHPQNGHYISYYEINKRFEVIGNIYDNPELLKESDLNDNCTSNKNKRWRNIFK